MSIKPPVWYATLGVASAILGVARSECKDYLTLVAVRARYVVYPSGFPPGTPRPNPPEPGPITVERHISGRRYLTEISVGGDLSLLEVANFFDVNTATVWRWVRAGKLNARKERGRLRVPVREVFRFERREGGPWFGG